MDIGEALQNEWRHLRHHVQAVPAIPATQENHMTTPQQPRLVDSLHAITGDIAANPLVARLLEHGLGKRLTQLEGDHIAALVASIEQGRGPQYAQLADTAPHDGGTQQQPAQPQ